MTTLFVSTVGGPLHQLHQLVPRLAGVPTEERLWVTHDVAQSRSLLEGEQVIYVPYVRERNLVDVLANVPRALGTLRLRRVEAVVSTGSAIAVAYLGAAAAMRRRAIFIETAAFVTSRTRTARIVATIPSVETFVQWPSLANPRWSYRGSVFDGYQAERLGADAAVRRVVVTVGTSEQYGFRRLLERVCRIVPRGVEILWQTGCTDVTGLGIRADPWIAAEDLAQAMEVADVVVAHAGCGSALAALAAGRRPILVPRRGDQGEVGDGHQDQIATRLAASNLALARDVDVLQWEDFLEAAKWGVRRAVAPPPFDLSPRP